MAGCQFAVVKAGQTDEISVTKGLYKYNKNSLVIRVESIVYKCAFPIDARILCDYILLLQPKEQNQTRTCLLFESR